jgi:hypothetical protein
VTRLQTTTYFSLSMLSMDTHTTANVSFDITHLIFVDLGLKTWRPVVTNLDGFHFASTKEYGWCKAFLLLKQEKIKGSV